MFTIIPAPLTALVMWCLRGLIGLAMLFGVAGADVSQILAVSSPASIEG